MKQALVFTGIFSVVKVLMAMTVNDIRDCPSIAPHAPPMNVHDLRADDIAVIAALGDRYCFKVECPFIKTNCIHSVTAGMVAENIDTPYLSKDQFIEYRGQSWVMGGVSLKKYTLVGQEIYT